MPRRQKHPLRSISSEERSQLEQLSRCHSAPASHVTRARALLAVADGFHFAAAARLVGRRSGDAVAVLVARFNDEGLYAIVPRHGGGPPRKYTIVERHAILSVARRPPDREQDGTATWSLTTLRRAVHREGLPTISRHALWGILRDAGLSWQANRTWCDTGAVQRRRKSGVVTVIDPDTEAKKS
jgi:transposase